MADQNTKLVLDTLRDYEKRSLIHAVGLPAQAVTRGSWTGIEFQLDQANLLGRLEDVVEIMPPPAVTTVPGAKGWVLGIANVRGTLVPVVDLRGYLTGNMTTISKQTRVVVANQLDGVVGLLVDSVGGQRQFEKEEHSSGGHFFDHMVADLIGQEFDKDGEYWAELDLQRLVNSPEFLQAAS